MGRARCAQDPASKRAGRDHSRRIGCVAPPSDEAASKGRPADPGPPKGSRRSAAPAMARLRLPRRTLPDRAKCAHSDPHQLPHTSLRIPRVSRHPAGGGSKSASDLVADRIGPLQPTCRNQIQKAHGAKLDRARPQPWRQCGKMESFGIASDHFSFSRMRGARSLRRKHRAARVPYPRGPSNPWSTRAALPRRGHPEIFRPFLRQKFSKGCPLRCQLFPPPGASKVRSSSIGTGDLGARVSARNSSRNIFLEWRTPSVLRPRSTSSSISPRGAVESLQVLGRTTARGATRRFFSRRRTFDYFSISNAAALCRPGRSRVRSMACGRRAPPLATQLHSRGEYFSGTREAPGGISKLSPIAWTTAWQAHAFFPEIPETFFLAGKAPKKLPRNSGLGGWVGAT